MIAEEKKPVPLVEPETVEDYNLFTTRIPVPGGWMYRSYDKEYGVMGACFVPDPKPTPEPVNAEMYRLLKRVESDLLPFVHNDKADGWWGELVSVLDKVERGAK